MKTKQEILDIINALQFETDILQKLMAMIDAVPGDTLDEDTVREIKIILLEEEGRALDQAAAELGIDVTNDPDLKAVEAEYKQEVAEIQAEFDTDMQTLDGQIDELEVASQQVAEADDAAQIAELRAAIQAS